MNRTKLAARYHFGNCMIAFYTSGKTQIQNPVAPPTNKTILRDRFYIPIVEKVCEFESFLRLTSDTLEDFDKKCLAIGYMLCNELPKGDLRNEAFLCVNKKQDTFITGKFLFAKAVSLFHRTKLLPLAYTSPFVLADVTQDTTLVVADDIGCQRHLSLVFEKCHGDWIIKRPCQPREIIGRARAPYLLAATNIPSHKIRDDRAFLRRFVKLWFVSPMPGEPLWTRQIFGHNLFLDWDEDEWMRFYSFMFGCINTYLAIFRAGRTINSIFPSND